jgi:hypothetical protein
LPASFAPQPEFDELAARQFAGRYDWRLMRGTGLQRAVTAKIRQKAGGRSIANCKMTIANWQFAFRDWQFAIDQRLLAATRHSVSIAPALPLAG